MFNSPSLCAELRSSSNIHRIPKELRETSRRASLPLVTLSALTAPQQPSPDRAPHRSSPAFLPQPIADAEDEPAVKVAYRKKEAKAHPAEDSTDKPARQKPQPPFDPPDKPAFADRDKPHNELKVPPPQAGRHSHLSAPHLVMRDQLLFHPGNGAMLMAFDPGDHFDPHPLGSKDAGRDDRHDLRIMAEPAFSP